MRRILAGALAVLAAGAFLFLTLGNSNGNSNGAGTYKIELDNAFGLVNGADFKVGGVIAGSIKSIDLDQKTLHALVTVSVSQKGFGSFHSDVFCQSRPQSLIGEYFLDCEPGSQGKVLKPGSTIPVSHTQSTIPADLVQNIMRLPYRQRFSILINELGAAVASRSEDLQTALRRADPALAETDNLLNLLANDAHIIRNLNVNANSVITALANNSRQVQNFIVQANKISSDSATQASSIEATWKKLPAFLEQLRPAMAKLGAAADAQDPVFRNLNAASANLRVFFHELTPFSRASLPSLRSLGQASLTGKPAVRAATPTVAHLNQFSQHAPELAQNLAIVLHDLDDRGRAVETDPRSPGGKGYSGLEALLEYVFNITLAINYYGPYGHLLGVDAFADPVCSPYATPQTIANSIASNGLAATRHCYAFLGPNQPGVTTPDPSWNAKDKTPANPSPCVPDPGGFPIQGYGTHYYGAKTSVCKLGPSNGPASDQPSKQAAAAKASKPGATGGQAGSLTSAAKRALGGGAPAINLKQTIGQILSALGNAANTGNLPNVGTTAGSATGAATDTGASAGSQAQQLLNYLLAP